MPRKEKKRDGPHPIYTGDIVKIIRELHTDLTRKWKQHEKILRGVWAQLSRSQREGVLKGNTAGGVVLQHRDDETWGEMCFLVPEWNLDELAQPESDRLLDLIKHRATSWLSDQYMMGPSGAMGDEQCILERIRQSDTAYEEFVNGHYRNFASEYHYGEELYIPVDEQGPQGKELPRGTQPAIIGHYILIRQMHFLQMMNIVVWEILALNWKKESTAVERKPQSQGTMGLIGLCLKDDIPRLTVWVLAEMAWDNKRSLDDWAWLCRTDTEYLIRMIYVWFFTQPGFIPDSDDLLLPAVFDRHVSACFFEMLHTFVLNAAVWDYLARLLDALVSVDDDDRFYHAAVLQELVNVIHYQYERSRALVKRYSQRSVGSKYLRRVDGPNNSRPRVVLKNKPGKLKRWNPLAHYILRLYQSETKVADAGHWLRKTLALYRPEKGALGPIDALHELAAVVGLFRQLKELVELPAKNPRKGQRYIRQLTKMRSEVDSIKESLDLSELAVPLERLRCPGVTEAALNKVDEVIADYTGTQLSKLYEEINEHCFSELRRVSDENMAQEQRAKDLAEEQRKKEMVADGFLRSTEGTPIKSLNVEERKQKTKTRPVHTSEQLDGDTTPLKEAQKPQPRLPEALKTYKVRPESLEVFNTLLGRTEPRGSIAWTAFTAAMVDLGFSTQQRYGSSVQFEPPSSLGDLKAFTFHRPHGAHLEGYRLLWLARRLKRVFDWDIACFEAV